MGLSDGEDCKVPKWTEPALKDALVSAYYGSASLIDTNEDVGDALQYRIDGTPVACPATPGFYFSKNKKIFIR